MSRGKHEDSSIIAEFSYRSGRFFSKQVLGNLVLLVTMCHLQ